MTCNYCPKLATQRIPAVHGDACLAHTIEFWTGFLTYARENPLPLIAPAVVVAPLVN